MKNIPFVSITKGELEYLEMFIGNLNIKRYFNFYLTNGRNSLSPIMITDLL